MKKEDRITKRRQFSYLLIFVLLTFCCQRHTTRRATVSRWTGHSDDHPGTRIHLADPVYSGEIK